MGSVVVDVMPKSAQLDPMGRAVTGAMPVLGFPQFVDVRQGKRFVLTVEGEVTREVLASARLLAEKTLTTPGVEEIVSVREAGDATDLDDDVDADWEDMPEHWGGGDTVPPEVGSYRPRKPVAHHRIDESMLGQVEAGSYYGRAEDVRSDRLGGEES
ncbi:phosphoribosylformylglycinamidine synthase subunit PurS [Mobilicoccus caccae]|uniref:phosphoribosylformylglycinamidine synthase subunit PurS n=1 Tax=Mobilicoccus caccae TaxID=1859295 RepID=UPI003D66EB55